MQKELKKTKSMHGIDTLLLIFFVCQPFVDIYKTFCGDTIQIGPFAIEEFFNWAFVGVMVLWMLADLYRAHNMKAILKYVFYFVLVGVYLVLHCLNISEFNQNLLPAARISVVTEVYYIFRVYLVPMLLFFLILQNGIADDTFNKSIQLVVLVISAVIVVTNIFCISFASYSDDFQTIKGGLFSWFSHNLRSMPKEDLKLYTSKGWFYSANQLSALMFALLPIVVKESIRKTDIKNCLLVALQVIAMIMLGTRTASAGCLIVVAAMMLVVLFLHLTKLDRIQKMRIIPILLVILILGSMLKYISPGQGYRNSTVEFNTQDRPQAEESIDEAKSDNDNDNEKTLEAYLSKYAYNYYIKDWFLEIYPVSGDEEFWTEMITRDRTLNIDSRAFKIDMISRIVERNDNAMDKVLGIGYTSNVPYTERDYAYQYFIFGGAGILLFIGPYVAVLCYAAYRILRSPKHYLTSENCSVGMSLGCMVVIAYFSGHVYGILINMLFLSLYAGKLLLNVRKEEKMN